jgi:hypothetical protein
VSDAFTEAPATVALSEDSFPAARRVPVRNVRIRCARLPLEISKKPFVRMLTTSKKSG